MACCECCWEDAASMVLSGEYETKTEAYYAAMKIHEARGCACSHNQDDFTTPLTMETVARYLGLSTTRRR